MRLGSRCDNSPGTFAPRQHSMLICVCARCHAQPIRAHQQVKKELQEIYQQYEPILANEERERSERWNSFLSSLDPDPEDPDAQR